MSEPIKNFSIFKVENKGENQPTHSISAKIGDQYVSIGSCWTKEGTKGKYLSCALSKPYQDKPGFHVEVEMPVKSTKTSPGVDGEVIDLADSPF